jgi:hypothetical protein
MSSLTQVHFVKTITETVRSRGIIHCTHPGCDRWVQGTEATVPDLVNLYLKARRGGEVDSQYPLTASELAADVRCPAHPLPGIRMFPILGTAGLMDRWIARNLEVMAAAERDRSQKQRERRHQKGHSTDGFVNRTLATVKPAEEKPRPQKRSHYKKFRPERPVGAPKRFGDEPKFSTETAPSKKKKGR